MMNEAEWALGGKGYLIIERDTRYSKRFREFVEEGGTVVIRLPPLARNLNAFAEPIVRSIRRSA